jgi:predicted RNA binding protein YcfA (HicA-like mRNA interferase family)
MQSAARPLSSHEVVGILAVFGFSPVLQSGTHHHLVRAVNNRLVTVPSHPEIARGTLLAILRKAGVDPEDFRKLRGQE